MYSGIFTSCSKNVKLEDLRVCIILSSVISVPDSWSWLDAKQFCVESYSTFSKSFNSC
jgi:hypothetical protein